MSDTKPVKENIIYNDGSSLKVVHVKKSTFSAPWHFHPEYELVYIIKGEGRRIIGHKVKEFSHGDLVLIGGYLPHVWIGSQQPQTESKSKNKEILQADWNFDDQNLFKKGTIDRVMGYVAKNFTREITLESIAKVACMNKTAFCRFFKKHAERSFFEFLSELRVSYACKLLQDKNLSISEICNMSGYINKSNFNRKFREITGISPTQFRKKINIPVT